MWPPWRRFLACGRRGWRRCSGSAEPDPVPCRRRGRDLIDQYQAIASDIRKLGVSCSVYYNDAKLKKQLRYASSAGFRYVVIANKDELAANKINVKDMSTGQQTTASLSNLRADTFPFFWGKGQTRAAVPIPTAQDPTALSELIKDIMGIPK